MDDAAGLSPRGLGHYVSFLIGWAYFLAWSASFYPQAILNWRRKSVQGLSMDFIYLNVLGFSCYSAYNLAFFYSSEIQEEYKRRNNGQENLVRANDVFFSLHALILSTFTLVQTWIYQRDNSQRVSTPVAIYIGGVFLGTIFASADAVWGPLFGRQQRLEWIDTLYFLSYVKLIISFIKYVPQAYINYQAKSTVGWSIYNILLDFTGGVLSIAQLILDASLSGDWSGVSGDLVKFGLGFLSIAFDLVFMTQHYILYRDRTDYAVKENGHGIDGHSNLADRDNERQGLLDHGPKKKYGGSQRSYDPENGSQGSGARE